MELILQKNIKPESAQCDGNSLLTLSSLLDYLQIIAGEHANKLHFGITDLNRQNDTWVLSRLRVEIKRWPQKGEEIVLKTWPKGVDRLFAIRDFKLYDIQENVIVNAASYWLVIDKKSKRPKMMSNIFKEFDYPQLSAIDRKLDRIPALIKTAYSSKIKTTEAEIDVNGHVNNVWYADWIMKTLPEDIRTEKRISSFEINYLSELFANESVEIELGWSDEDKDFMLGRLIRNDKEVCRVKLEF